MSYAVILRQLLTYLRSLMSEKSALKLTNIFRTLSFTDINFTDFIFTDIIIHAKAYSVQVMSVIIMSDNVTHKCEANNMFSTRAPPSLKINHYST